MINAPFRRGKLKGDEVMKYLQIHLSGGSVLKVKGDSYEEVPGQVTHRNGWALMELLNGQFAQVWSNDIVAVEECVKFQLGGMK